MKRLLRQLPRVELRRKRRLWIAALCASSFLVGQMLFGDEPQPKLSRIGQYLRAKIHLTSGTQDKTLAPAKTQASATSSSRRSASSREAMAAPSGPYAEFIPVEDFRQALDRAIADEGTDDSAKADTVQVVANPLPSENKPADDENLPPIIPASAMPRPRPKNRQPGITGQPASAPMGSAAAAIAPTAVQPPKTSPWRINLGGNPLPSVPVDEPEAPATPRRQDPSNSQGPQSSPESRRDAESTEPRSSPGQTTRAMQNPFVSPRNRWTTATDMESAMPRTLFQSQTSPATTGSTPQLGNRGVGAAPVPYPMPLEIINPNVTRRPVVQAGASELIPAARVIPPVHVAQAAPAPGESNPLRPPAKVDLAKADQATVESPATYDEPRLLVEPLSKDTEAKTNSSGNLKQMEPPFGKLPAQKSSRRRYMVGK